MSTPTDVDPRPNGRKQPPSRRALMKGAAWATPVAAFSIGAPAMAFSPSCTDDSLLNSQARAQMLSGQIGGANLDVLAEVNGVHAQAFDPIADGADSTATDLKTNPLTVEALSAINLNLGGLSGALTTILDFVTAQDAGVLNEYAYANENAQSALVPEAPEVGGAGAVGNDGTIALSVDDPNPPALGTINLYSILEQAAGAGVAELVDLIAGLDLDIGAVAGLAELDYVCDTERGLTDETVDRDYLLAYLRLVLELGLVEDLVGDLETLEIDTDSILDDLSGVLESVLGDAGGLVGQLLSALLGGTVSANVTLNVDALTNGTIPSDTDALQINLGEGTVTIDVASLLGGAYNGAISPWLNELPPNTRLFTGAYLPTVGVAELVGSLVTDLLARIEDLIEIDITVSTLGLAELSIAGTLGELLSGEGDVTARLNALLGWVNVPLGDLVSPLLVAVGGVVEGLVDTVFGDGEGGLIADALGGLNVVLDALFSLLGNVLAITVNAQNSTTSGTMPAYFGSITPERRYDVAALHVAVLEVANEGLLNLSVARGSVGQNEYRAGA